MLSEERAEAGGSIRCDEYKCAGWKRMGEMGGAGRREESVLCKFGAMAGDRGVGTDSLCQNSIQRDCRRSPLSVSGLPAFLSILCCWFFLPHGHVNVVRFKERIRGFERLRACGGLSFVCSVFLGELLPVGD